MTSVKLGSVMGGSVSARTPVPARLPTLSVWNVSGVCGTTVSGYIQAMSFAGSQGTMKHSRCSCLWFFLTGYCQS